ncbi:MAG: toxin-antitoxin system protein [Capnocytophaga sp.]|nr:toxin-antitoxin system protein [Capnocytophaga sp.]
MKTYTKTIFFTASLLSCIGCSKTERDGRFSDNPLSQIESIAEGSLNNEQQIKWNFTNTDNWISANQGTQADNNLSSIVDNSDCEDGKALKIYTQANTQQRQKLKTKQQFGAGLYTWRTYISDLGEVERVSIGSWLWNSDKHELDFEVGSGTATERTALGLSSDEVIAYITSQDNPFIQQKVKIKKNAWHTFQINLQLVNGKYFATWSIDGVKYAAQQLQYGQDYPFHIFCSTENLKFIGDTWPYQNNYGLWDYVSYTPYSYSIAPIEPSTQTNPTDVAPEPDPGERKIWYFKEFPSDWNKWTNVGTDGVAFNKIEDDKLVLSVNDYCITSKIEYKSPVSYGKYTWSVRFPDVSELTKTTKFQIGGTLYTTNDKKEAHAITMMAWYGTETERTRLGAKPNQLLLRLYSEIPGYEAFVAVLDPDKDYKLSIELKKVSNKYIIVYSLDNEVLKTLPTNYGEDTVKFLFISSAESNRNWMPGEKLYKKIDAKFNFIEYISY